MGFVGILIFMSLACSWGFRLPVDTIIVQVQISGVFGTQHPKHQVLFNGAPRISTDEEVDGIIKSMRVDKHLPNVTGINLTSLLRTCNVLRSRECILEGLELHWTDLVFCNGNVYLTLGHNDTWMLHVPETTEPKVLWDWDVERTRKERIQLQEGCTKLMRELEVSAETSVVPEVIVPRYVIPILCILLFIGLIVISFLLSKRQDLRPPAGAIGSVIHYPQNMDEMVLNDKGHIYKTM